MTSQPQPQLPEPAPVCPRHPDRVSYVRCQRCERPVCPQCQRQAPVGVQCVDCVKAAARARPTIRTVFGGRVSGPRPVVTMALVGVTAAIYVLQLLGGAAFTEEFQFSPQYAASEPWRMLTSGFLHSPQLIFHIAFNMVALWMVGPVLEVLFGRVRFLIVYLLCAVGGSVGFFWLIHADPVTGWSSGGVLGASGAVFGLFGALLVANRRLRRDNVPLIGVLVFNGVIGVIWAGIAWQAHLGGFVTGLACAAALAATARRGPGVQYAALAGIFAVIVALAILRMVTLPPGLLV